MTCVIINLGLFITHTEVEAMVTTEIKDKRIIKPTLAWREWAKVRAQKAPSLERVHEITKKVKVNVTRLLLEERQRE